MTGLFALAIAACGGRNVLETPQSMTGAGSSSTGSASGS